MSERDGEHDELATEERVEALLRHDDGPVVLRPLDQPRDAASHLRTSLAAASFVVLVFLSGMVAIGALNARRQPATTTLPPAAPPSASASTTPPTVPPGGDFSTADGAAAAIRQGLERNDLQLLFGSMAPTGWYARWYGQTQTEPMSRADAVSWIWGTGSANGTWRVDAGPARDADPSMPRGEKYISAVVFDFHGWAEQRADIMLSASGGRWYWSSLLLFRPPPISANAGEVAGYATLVRVSDASVTVRFRTLGTRCCSDESWSGRTVVLRREPTSVYGKPGGDPAASLTETGAATGDDVWVRFHLDSVDAASTYAVGQLVKMYP